MKKLLTLFAFFMICATTSQAFVLSHLGEDLKNQEDFKALDADLQELGIEQFLSMTPQKYRERTGKRMGLKNAVKLKAAQKYVKRQLRKKGRDEDISSGVYILLAILGLGWVAMGILSDWDGNDWIVNLILTVLCWLPGLIHALVKKKDYYN